MIPAELALEFVRTTLTLSEKESDSIDTALVMYVGMMKYHNLDLEQAIKLLVGDFDNIRLTVQGDAPEESKH